MYSSMLNLAPAAEVRMEWHLLDKIEQLWMILQTFSSQKRFQRVKAQKVFNLHSLS